MSKKEFYKIIPQMKDYDQLGINWLPYIMFTQSNNFRSESVNTDNFGFRFNNKLLMKKNVINEENMNVEKNIICGGSFAFGTGSTKDDKTISSLMSDQGSLTLNLSGSAFVSFQDIITIISNINNLKSVKKIIIFTGINDLYLNKNFGNIYPDAMFFSSFFSEAMDNKLLSKQKKFFKSIVNFFNPNFINSETIKKLHKGNILNFIFSKKFRENLSTKAQFTESFFEDKIKRNFKIYKMISKFLNVEIEIYLSPYIFWSKDLSSEEKNLVELTKKFYSKEIKKIYSLLNNESYQYLVEILTKYSQINGFNFIDINKYFKDNFSSKNWLFVDSVYCTDLGYKEVSNMILNK